MRDRAAKHKTEIDAMTSLPRWDGSQPDYDIAMEILARADGLLRQTTDAGGV